MVYSEPPLGCFLLLDLTRAPAKQGKSVQREQGLETDSKHNVAIKFLIKTVNIENEGFSVGTFICLYGKNTFINTFI